MNILVFSVVFYPAIGGLENQTLILLREFVKSGHKIKVITKQKQDAPIQNIEIFENPNVFQTMKLYFWSNAVFMPNISLKGAWMLLLNPFKRWIISHNDFYLIDKLSFTTRLKLFFIRFASQNIAVSKSVADYIPTKSTIIYNCYDDSVFRVYEDEERIYDFVFLGRLITQKGCDLLIKACKDLKKPFTLSIIGKGPEEERLKKMMADFNLNGSVQFLGVLEGEPLARVLNQHRTMVIPSMDVEGFGIVALEGMACGCRLVAANAGGLSEAVNKYGKKFKMGDQHQLGMLLEDDLNNKTFRNKISEEQKSYLGNHKKSVVAGKYLYYFDEQ